MAKGDRRGSRSRSRRGSRSRSRRGQPSRAFRSSLEQQLRSFKRRYPADDRATEFLEKSDPKVVEQVLRDWRPPHENQADYSALLTNFVRQVRNRLGCHTRRDWNPAEPEPAQRGSPDQEPRRSRSEENHEVEILADEDDHEHREQPAGACGDGGGEVSLRELVREVGKALHREAKDVEPFVTLLEENWYDTVKSLEDVTAQDLAAVGVPLRFAKELLEKAGRKTSSTTDLAPAILASEVPKGRGKGFEKGKGKGKGKYKGRGGGKMSGKGKGKDKDMAGDARSGRGDLVRSIPVRLDRLRSGEAKERIAGANGEHFRYIRSKARAEVWLEGAGSGHGDPRDPLAVQVRADSHSDLDYAAEMVEDLLAKVTQDGGRRRR